MESDERYYRRRASEELAAARRAVTAAGQERRLRLAESYLHRLGALSGQARAMPAARGSQRAWILD